MDFVKVGNYGGFSGLHVSLKIYENGKLEYSYMLLGDSSTIAIESIPAQEAKDLIKEFRSHNVLKMEMNESGNMNYYIELQKGRRRNYIQWGDIYEDKVSQTLYDLYEKTFGFIPQDVNSESGEWEYE